MKRKINKKTRIYSVNKDITAVVVPESAVAQYLNDEQDSKHTLIYFKNKTLLKIAEVLKNAKR